VKLLSRFFTEQEFVEQRYSAEVLCSNWVARPPEKPALAGRRAGLERLGEADVLTFLARIYASQQC